MKQPRYSNPDHWTIDSGGVEYYCSFSQCNNKGVAQKDTMAMHIWRDHLNVALQCHYCPKLFWSREGWHRHTTKKHSSMPPVPAEAPPCSDTYNNNNNNKVYFLSFGTFTMSLSQYVYYVKQ